MFEQNGVDLAAFSQAVASWQNFYLMLGGASSALTGLLFVALSLNLRQIRQSSRIDLQAFVSQTFAYFLSVLIFSAIFLIPDQKPLTLGVPLLIMGIIGLVLVAGRFAGIARTREWQRAVALFLLPTLAFIALIAISISVLQGQTDGLYWMVAVMLILLGVATGNAYRLLVDLHEI